MNNFYVYCHQKKSDGRCFYIGKGNRGRAYTEKGRNQYWHRVVKKHGYDVVILVNNISEERAFELEKEFIRQIGLENLVNMTEGGKGGCSGTIRSEETKKKIANSLKKPIKQYSKSGKLIKIWDSIKLASDTLKISRCNMTSCCTGKKKSAGGFIWRDADENLIINSEHLEKRVLQYDFDGNILQIWDNSSFAARTLKIQQGNIVCCCKGRKKSAGGFIWKYDTV